MSVGTEAVENWFKGKGWKPFAFQRDCWAEYRAGRSGLIHSPTGSGKTLAAFLGLLAEWIDEQPAWPLPKGVKPEPTGLRMVWITPLRALAADTLDSLKQPVADLALPWRVEGRTGDTSASVRARQAKNLPAVLVTTPESLTLLLTRVDARDVFAGLRSVVVDEWHELIGSKRGVQVELALARLRSWRPLRTWGVSATLGNLDQAKEVLLGPGSADAATVAGRFDKETVIDSIIPKKIERFPWAGHLGLTLLPQVVAAIDEGKTALVFTNTRSQTEIWYQAILGARPDWAGIMALHHGSLDRKVRDFVEDGLRGGQFRVVVCTSSLDLGVDYSPVDRVLQVGSPKGVARLMQRAGRSGHQPGAVSRLTFVPTNALELIEVPAAREAAEQGRIEPRPPQNKPLDLLAQHAVTVACGGGFLPDELYHEVRQSHAYRDLSPEEWRWVLDFVVRGGDALRAYPEFSRVKVDESGRHYLDDPKAVRDHRMGVGTIVSQGSVQVRFLKGPRLGTVEEGFVARLKPGDQFLFSGKVLEFVRMRDMVAWVRKAKARKAAVPRWSGGRMALSGELAGAIREQLARAADGVFDSPELEAVRPILEHQGRVSGLPVPGVTLVERLKSREGFHLFCYPFAGRLVHEGLSVLVAYRLSKLQPISFTMAVNDYGFELLAPTAIPFDAARWKELFSPENLSSDILSSLNATELARRHFREVARVAGLVVAGPPGKPKSAKQMQASSGLFFDVFAEHDPDNMLLVQARREVLENQLELRRMEQTLADVLASELQLFEVARPTPFGFPLMVDRLRETVSSEKLADRVRRMVEEMEGAASSVSRRRRSADPEA